MIYTKLGRENGAVVAVKREDLYGAPDLELPPWATHYAVRFCGRVEPAAWVEKARAYYSEDPAALSNGQWAGAFDERYWKFFPRDAVGPNASLSRGGEADFGLKR